MTKSESIAALTGALAKAQGEIKGAVKDSQNPFYKSSYADLASVWDACRQPLTRNGLAVIQTTSPGENGAVVVETTLAHSSGEWIGGALSVKPVKDDPQGMGSAITYARRYALAAIIGVAPEDDDGNAASGKHAEPKLAPQKTERKPEVKQPENGRDIVDSILKDPAQATDEALYAKISAAIKDAKKDKAQLGKIGVRMTEKLASGELKQETYNKLMEEMK